MAKRRSLNISCQVSEKPAPFELVTHAYFVCLCPPLSMIYSILKAAWRRKYGLWSKITSISSILYGWCAKFVYYWEDTPLGLFHLAVQRSFSCTCTKTWESGERSRYSELLRAPGLGFEVRWGQEIFSSPHPFRPAVVPTQPIQSVPGPFAEDQAAGEVLWPPTPHLALRLRMWRALPLLSLCACMACYRETVLKVLRWSIPFRCISFSPDTYGTWKSSRTLPFPRMGHRIKYYYYMAWNVYLSGCKSEFSFNVQDLHAVSLCSCELR